MRCYAEIREEQTKSRTETHNLSTKILETYMKERELTIDVGNKVESLRPRPLLQR